MKAALRAPGLAWLICVLTCCLLAGGIMTAAAEEAPWHVWKSAAGSTIEAKLISAGQSDVVLEKRDGKRITVKLSQLSEDDRAFLAAGARETPKSKTGETTVAGVDAVPGTVSGEITCQASSQWTYRIYLPKEFHTGRSWPVVFVMSPTGGSAKTLDRYLPAADHLGMILAVSKQAKNDFAKSHEATAAMVKDVYSRLPVLPGLAIASGMSGGSRMAYLLAESETNVAGILACGSGNGVYPDENVNSFRRANLHQGTIVCGLFGTNDFNRREGVRTHKDYKKDSRLIWFPGNHDWAPPDLILEGMTHVFGEILRRSKRPEWDGLRSEFAKRQLAWIKTVQEKSPWTTLRWAEYLTKFPGGAPNQSEAKSLAASLAGNAEVVRALKAEKEIEEFTAKYFADGNTQVDKTPDEPRLKAAEKRAEAFKGLPHAELLKLLGRPAA